MAKMPFKRLAGIQGISEDLRMSVAAEIESDFSLRKIKVAGVCLMGQLFGSSMLLIGPLSMLMLPMTQAFGGSDYQFSYATSAIMWAGALASPICGRLIGRRGVRPVVLIGTIALGLLSVALGSQTAALWRFYLLFGLAGVFGAVGLGYGKIMGSLFTQDRGELLPLLASFHKFYPPGFLRYRTSCIFSSAATDTRLISKLSLNRKHSNAMDGISLNSFRRFQVNGLSLCLLLIAICAGACHKKGSSGLRDEYVLSGSPWEFGQLTAVIGEKKYTIIDRSKEMCLRIVGQRDFDGNGTLDALVAHFAACAGNGGQGVYFFVLDMGKGRFVQTSEMGYSDEDPIIEKWQGKWSALIFTNNMGANTEPYEEFKERYIIKNGAAVAVEKFVRPRIKAVVEMNSNEFRAHGFDAEDLIIAFDIDGDGKKDKLIGAFGARWGTMIWKIQFSNGKVYESDIECRRIGILGAKTNGMRDLVCEQNDIFKWDGQKYVLNDGGYVMEKPLSTSH
jgi:hypothetical protein